MERLKGIPITMEAANEVVAKFRLSGKTAQAVRLFLMGICSSQWEAAASVCLDRAAVQRALVRVTRVKVCECCGLSYRVVDL